MTLMYLGSRRLVDVFDCGTHEPEKMTVHQFVKYYTSEEKSQILNVTSLEFSHTGLDRIVDGPTIVSPENVFKKTCFLQKEIVECTEKTSINAKRNPLNLVNMKYFLILCLEIAQH